METKQRLLTDRNGLPIGFVVPRQTNGSTQVSNLELRSLRLCESEESLNHVRTPLRSRLLVGCRQDGIEGVGRSLEVSVVVLRNSWNVFLTTTTNQGIKDLNESPSRFAMMQGDDFDEVDPRGQQMTMGIGEESALQALSASAGPRAVGKDLHSVVKSSVHTAIAKLFHDLASFPQPQQPPPEDAHAAGRSAEQPAAFEPAAGERGESDKPKELREEGGGRTKQDQAALEGFQIRRQPHLKNRYQRNISDEVLHELHHWFPELIFKALEVVDDLLEWLERPVAERKQQAPPINRVVCRENPKLYHFQVLGEARYPYVTTQHFCSCKAFYNSMTSRDRSIVCKHVSSSFRYRPVNRWCDIHLRPHSFGWWFVHAPQQLAMRVAAAYFQDRLPGTVVEAREYVRIRSSDHNNLKVLDKPHGM